MSGTITALKQQKRNPDRINIYLDGEYSFSLSKITAAWLAVGQSLSEEKISSLQLQDAQEVAYQSAIKYIQYRPHSSQEIRQYLSRHQIAPDVIEAVLVRLGRSGLTDDQEFAKMWVDNRSEFRPRSKRVLEMELRQRGIDHQSIDQALVDMDEERLAYKAGVKQAKRYTGLEKVVFKRKLFAYLARNGFNYDVIPSVVERIWNEEKHNNNSLEDKVR